MSAFSDFLGKLYKNRRDANCVQRTFITLPAITLPTKPPLLEGPSRDGRHQIDLAPSSDANELENEG